MVNISSYDPNPPSIRYQISFPDDQRSRQEVFSYFAPVVLLLSILSLCLSLLFFAYSFLLPCCKFFFDVFESGFLRCCVYFTCMYMFDLRLILLLKDSFSPYFFSSHWWSLLWLFHSMQEPTSTRGSSPAPSSGYVMWYINFLHVSILFPCQTVLRHDRSRVSLSYFFSCLYFRITFVLLDFFSLICYSWMSLLISGLNDIICTC